MDSFTYDVVGNLLTADNPFARITREYALDGLVTKASVALKDTASAAFDVHFAVELSGRRRARSSRAARARGAA